MNKFDEDDVNLIDQRRRLIIRWLSSQEVEELIVWIDLIFSYDLLEVIRQSKEVGYENE